MTQETISQKPPKTFATPFADSGDKNAIPDTGVDAVNIQQGFPSIFSTPRANSGKSVARRDMNGILNSLSSLNYYFQYMGRNPWVSGTSYPKGAKVWYNNAEWISPFDNNTTAPGGQNEDGEDAWIAINDLGGTVGGSGSGSQTDLTEVLNAISDLQDSINRSHDSNMSLDDYVLIPYTYGDAHYKLLCPGIVLPSEGGYVIISNRGNSSYTVSSGNRMIHRQGWYVTGRQTSLVDESMSASYVVGYKVNHLISRFPNLVQTYNNVYVTSKVPNSANIKEGGYKNTSSNSLLLKTHLTFDEFTGYEDCGFQYAISDNIMGAVVYDSVSYTGCSRSVSNGVVTEDTLIILPPGDSFVLSTYCLVYNGYTLTSRSQKPYNSFMMNVYSE